MTPSDIHAQCLAIEAQIIARGFLRPEVSFFVNFFGGSAYSVKVEMRTTEAYESVIAHYCHCSTVDEIPDLFAEGREWVAEQKSPAVLRHEKFLADLGRVIDEGRALNLDVDFMNPLVESMRRLSENVIEFKPAAE